MITEHIHPVSGKKISGIILGPGALLLQTDVFASTSGRWEHIPNPNIRISPEGSGAVIVRPNVTLSEDAKTLLIYLINEDYLLAYRQMWIVVPTPRWAYDGRMQWQVRNPSAACELVELGFVCRNSKLESSGRAAIAFSDYGCQDPNIHIYQVTSHGREFAQTFVS